MITKKRAKLQQWRFCFSFQHNNQPFQLSTTTVDRIDVLLGYSGGLLDRKAHFLFGDHAWRDMEKCHKL